MGEKLSIPNVEGHSFEGVYYNVHKNVVAFAKRYETAYMWFYLQQLHQDLDGKASQQKWQLAQRKWESYNRPLKKGVLYVLADASGKKWKKRYCVMQSNYAMEVYASKEDYEKAGKPKISAKYSGHDVAQNVDTYLQGKLKITSRDFGYVNHDVSAFIKKVTLIGQAGKRPTQHIFCVAHQWRGTTYFAAETAVEKDHWVRILKDSVRHLEGTQCSSETSRETFGFALEQTIRMQGYCVPAGIICGTQEEILTDLFSDCQSYECKEILLPAIKGGFASRYKVWNYVLFELRNMTKGIVIKEFVKKRQQFEEKCESRRQDIIANLPQLNAAYESTSNAIKGGLSECFDQVVVGEILPRLPEVVSAMSDSLVTPLRATRELFLTLVEGVQKAVTSSTNQQFANNVDQYFLNTLDFAPRNPDFVCPMSDSMSSKKPIISMLENMFPRTDFSSHIDSIFTYQQKLLDTAVYTFETLCGDAVNQNDGKLTPSTIAKVRTRVLKKLDYDIILAQRRFFRAVIKSGTMEHTRESIEQTCKPKMLDFEATIPDDLSQYMPISNVFTDVLTKRFTELINPALTNCMKQLMSDNLAGFHFRSSSTLSSVSSYSSAVEEDPNKPASRTTKPLISRDTNGELSPHLNNCVPSSGSNPSASVVVEQSVQEEDEPCASGMDGETGETYKARIPDKINLTDYLVQDHNPSPDVELGEREVEKLALEDDTQIELVSEVPTNENTEITEHETDMLNVEENEQAANTENTECSDNLALDEGITDNVVSEEKGTGDDASEEKQVPDLEQQDSDENHHKDEVASNDGGIPKELSRKTSSDENDSDQDKSSSEDESTSQLPENKEKIQDLGMDQSKDAEKFDDETGQGTSDYLNNNHAPIVNGHPETDSNVQMGLCNGVGDHEVSEGREQMHNGISSLHDETGQTNGGETVCNGPCANYVTQTDDSGEIVSLTNCNGVQPCH
uniref:Niban-like protein 2 n=1 Tax=Phallusia mammillata TaxID=59560 RepID=A0A6F9DBP6_9ASCI|nr:niban-like protein 2 [Phallusia mammillata]